MRSVDGTTRILLLLLALLYLTCLCWKCGNNLNLPANSSVEYGPAIDYRCCHNVYEYAEGGNEHQTCEDCVDYRVVQDLKDSETNSTITRVGDFLKTVCSDVEDKTEHYFKCVNSDLYCNMYISSEYNVNNMYYADVIDVSKVCVKDDYAYPISVMCILIRNQLQVL